MRPALAVLLAALGLSWDCSAGTVLPRECESTISVEPPTGTGSAETDFSVELTSGAWIAPTRSIFEDDEPNG